MKFKCGRNGKGYKIGKGFITTYQERVLFIKKPSSPETDEKSQYPKVGISRFSEAQSSCSFSGTKRKDDDDSTNEIEGNSKRIKNESNLTNDSPKEGDEEASVEESLFSNDLLLRTIFVNLKVEDLKSCRRVNSLWNLEATKILLTRDCLKAIQLSNEFVKIHDTVDLKPLTGRFRFENILTNSKLSPFTYFAVNQEILDHAAVDFFLENGHHVKSFCFEPDEPSMINEGDSTAGDILILVATCCPNLTTLKFVHAYEDPTPAITLLAIKNIPDLTNLHTLEITNYFPRDVVSLILEKASNLQNIYLRPEKDSSYTVDLLKLTYFENVIPRLKNIHVWFSFDTLEIYQKVLDQKPRFSSIKSLDGNRHGLVDSVSAGRILTEMFNQCSKSLTEILGIRRLKEFTGVQIPVFPNVKRLGINLQSLPSGVNLAEIFPKVTSIQLEFSDADEPEEILLDSLSPLLSVRQLRVKSKERYVPQVWVKRLHSLFPNVISAQFFNPLPNSAYQYVWKLSKLRHLHLAIGTDSQAKFSELDCAFTGFSLMTAENFLELIENGRFNLTPEEVEALRIMPSIVDLKELKKLKLQLFDATIKEGDINKVITYNMKDTFGEQYVEVIFDPGNGDSKVLLQVDGKIILSCISKRFGFDLCPWLNSNVSVGYTEYIREDDESSDGGSSCDYESDY